MGTRSDAIAYPQGRHIAVVDRKTLTASQITVWEEEEIGKAAWSPDGKWIACGGKQGSFKLISPDGATQKSIVCRGLDSSSFSWHPNGRTLAGIVNGALSLISLDGVIVKGYGKASSVDGWSPDGRYIAYGFGDGRLSILSLFDGEVVDVAISGRCYIGVWKPQGELLTFWHDTGLMVVGPDGKDPKLFGSKYHGSTMSPSWLAPERTALRIGQEPTARDTRKPNITSLGTACRRP